MTSWRIKTAPMAHQIAGVEKLARLRVGALFQEPGTGKTFTTLMLAERRQERAPRVVWLCPVAAKATIRHEVLKHTTLTEADVHVFGDRTRPGRVPDARVHIVGTESLSSSDRVTLALAGLIDEHTLVVGDESDMLRTPDARRTLRATLLARPAWGRVILSGTPVPEGMQGLYAQMRFLDPRILGHRSWYSFQRAHVRYDEDFPGRVREILDGDVLARAIAPYTYQVSRAECLDLPPQVRDEWFMTPGEAQLAAYAQARREFLEDVPEDALTRMHIYGLFTALQQIASGFWNRRDPHTGVVTTHVYPNDRLAVLAGAAARVPAGEKLIVWCKYHRSVEAVAALLAPYGVALHHGRLSVTERDAQLRAWRDPAGPRVFVGTPGTGGRALTLNEASHALFYERSFPYAENYQAELRNHRIGKEGATIYTDITSDLGIERRIREALANKEGLSQLFYRQLRGLRSMRDGLMGLVA